MPKNHISKMKHKQINSVRIKEAKKQAIRKRSRGLLEQRNMVKKNKSVVKNQNVVQEVQEPTRISINFKEDGWFLNIGSWWLAIRNFCCPKRIVEFSTTVIVVVPITCEGEHIHIEILS